MLDELDIIETEGNEIAKVKPLSSEPVSIKLLLEAGVHCVQQANPSK